MNSSRARDDARLIPNLGDEFVEHGPRPCRSTGFAFVRPSWSKTMAREELKCQNIDADDLPAAVKKSFDAIALVGSLADPIFAAFAGLNYSGIVLVMGGGAWHLAYAMLSAIRLRTAPSTSLCFIMPSHKRRSDWF